MSGSLQSSRGFTLIEILVVMSLLSLLALGMGSALRTTAQIGERVDSKLLEADELRVTAAFLRSVLGRMHVQRLNAPTAVGQQPYFFEGTPVSVTWVGIMPARHGVGGRSFFQLSLGQSEGQQGLLLQFLPWDSTTVRPDWSQAQTRVLVRDAVDLQLKYVSTTVNEPRWSDAWESPDALPDRVMISLRSPSGRWPDLVVPVRTTPAGLSGAGSGEAVFGGNAN
ncbi:MAG: prepilin-type N-terminal cleavage/methylation domain-containing protein [Comamonadaceae bacterium]|nr:MAG: prepilin-type N-terminal cleavage/methylation domain-containing protein [Comamonadaceae bacterium]